MEYLPYLERKLRRKMNTMKVLIVDDEDAVRRSLGHIVALRGWKAFVHDQHADCVALIREHGIDVLITDFSMPSITGLDLIEKLRDGGIEIPVLILSANIYAIDRDRAKRLNVFRILSKPPDVKQLRNVLTAAVASSNGKQMTD